MPGHARAGTFRRLSATVALAATLGTLAVGGPSAADRGEPDPVPVPPRASLDREVPGAGRATWGPNHMVNEFVGLDGATYSRAPWTTQGLDGTLYFGEEFDTACGYGDRFGKGLRRFAMLADVIERSGRRVVFTVAPNKSSVNKPDLIRSTVPHGRCSRVGMRQQERALDEFEDSRYVDVRGQLAALSDANVQAYWHLDTHWTTIGHTRVAYALARRLDPDVAAHQRYLVRGQRTITPDVAALIGQPDVKETAPRRRILTRTKVETVPGSDLYHPVRHFTVDHEWRSSPARYTLPGRTAVIGDSFMFLALESIRPLFRHGHFLWIGDSHVPDIIREIVKSDTVVIEIVQRYMPDSVLTHRSTRLELKKALAATG